MNWFTGEVSSAIKKAINEKKVFIVFVKDEKENSTKMEELWNDAQVVQVCCDQKCVAISISAASVPGQQFGAIYPILCVPSTYLINNQGTPTDIIPGVLEKEEFAKRLKDAIDKTLLPSNSECQDTAVDSKNESEINNEQPTTSSSEAEQEACIPDPNESAADVENTDTECKSNTGKELKDTETKRRGERQAIQLAKEIADRKAEEKAARDKIREQIRQDRLEKTRRFDTEKKEREYDSRKKAETSAQAEKKKADSNTARLQFRLPDGSSVSNQFNAEAKFLVAEAFIKDHIQLPNVRLTTVYPRHEFDSEDALKTFRELGLVPNACIIVSQGRSTSTSRLSSSSSLNPLSFIMFVLAPIFAIFNWIASLFTGNTNNGSGSEQSTVPSYPPQSNQRDDSVRRRNIQSDSPSRSNIQRLRRDDDDENATWNGNSTQQM